MKNSSFLILLVCCFAYSLADDIPEWDSLRITFGDPNDKNSFDHMPRTKTEAEHRNWTLLDNQCSSSSSMFQGLRYWKDDEPASILLFDKNGWIAGIQTSVPEYVNWTPSPTYLNSYILNETDSENKFRLTLTAYFVDPKIVCTGRTPKQFVEEGTGTDLYIQSGKNPKTDYLKIPMTQEEVKDTPWGHGKCFYNMGQHFWRNVTKTMNCDDFFPFCLMYNKGRLNAFCFAINANVRPSARYEHPDLGEVKDFIEPVPDCMYSDPSFENTTSLHVYLSENIQLNKC